MPKPAPMGGTRKGPPSGSKLLEITYAIGMGESKLNETIFTRAKLDINYGLAPGLAKS
jgi:hypothetical protein